MLFLRYGVKVFDGFDGQDSPDHVVGAVAARRDQMQVLPRAFDRLDVNRGEGVFLHESLEEFGFVVLGVDD